MNATNPTNNLSELLTICRAQLCMSLEDMARALRLSPSGVSQIERGLINPSRTTRIRIVQFLKRNGYEVKA